MNTNEKEKIIYQAADIIQDLSDKGYTKYRIAKETGIAEKTIGNYVNGVNKPSFANAKIIIKYYTGEGEMQKNEKEIVNSPKDSVPYEFVQALFEERERADEQRIELLKQNGKLIDILHADREKTSTAGAV